MAILRKRIIKLGVSYGSGCIKFGNDELAYCDALRAFPEDGTYAAFKEALEAVDAEAVAAAQQAEDKAQAQAAGVEESAPAEEAAAEDAAAAEAEAAEQPVDGAAGAAPAAGAADAELAEQAEEPSPYIPFEIAPDDEEEAEDAGPVITGALQAAIDKAKAYRSVCSKLAFSDMHSQVSAIIATLSAGELPPVADVMQLDESYNALIDYLTHC